MIFTLFFVLALEASAAAKPSNSGFENPKDNKDMEILADMLFVPGQLEQAKVGLPANANKHWPDKEVPYTIDASLVMQMPLIMSATDNIMSRTCIKFVQRRLQKNFVRMFSGQGCYSNVGMVGRAQPLSLGRGCLYMGTVIHELVHPLGFYHEQNRNDTDEYITVYYQNVQQGAEEQFFKLRPSEEETYGIEYDYANIMQYGETAFSRNGRAC